MGMSPVEPGSENQSTVSGVVTAAPAPSGDRFYKRLVAILTAAVLIYPLAGMLLYPWLASINMQPDTTLLWIGGGILGINLLVAIPLRDHLRSLHERCSKARATVIGMVEVAQGAEAVDRMLATVDTLFSWRYLYRYIGILTSFLYYLLSGWALFGLVVWLTDRLGFAGPLIPDFLAAPMRLFGVYVFGYYVIAVGVRYLLRPLIEPLTRVNGH